MDPRLTLVLIRHAIVEDRAQFARTGRGDDPPAEILGEAYGGLPIDRLDAAASGDGDELLEMLRSSAPGTTIAVVGHEPTHGEWTGWLLSGRDAGFVRYKKGEACALEFSRDIRLGSAELLWKLRPKQLRALGTEGRRIGDADTTK